jgi:hypothetical protein
MNRLNIINFINPSWHSQIIEFLVDRPEFTKLLPIVALDEYPTGFNKNPHETDENAPINIFETIIYGISHAGLSVEDGNQHYKDVLHFFRSEYVYNKDNPFPDDIPFSFSAPIKKLETYTDLVRTLFDQHIFNPHNMTFKDLKIAESIGGIGDSTIDLVNLLHCNIDDACVIPSDPHFIAGINKFFGLALTDITEPKMKEITGAWKNKKVGVMFIIQYAYYSEFCI